MNKKWGLAKVFVISFIVILCVIIGIAFRMSIIGKIKDSVFVIQAFKYVPVEYVEEYLLNMIIINNIKYIIKALIFSALSVFLIILLVAHFMKGEKGDKIKNLILVTFISILFLVCINVGMIILGENIQVPISIVLESKISERDKYKIENMLNETDEIIEYECISSEERF